MSKPTEVLGDRIVRHAKVPKNLVRDSRNPRRGGRRRICSDLLRTTKPFDTRFKTVQVAPLLLSELLERTIDGCYVYPWAPLQPLGRLGPMHPIGYRRITNVYQWLAMVFVGP